MINVRAAVFVLLLSATPVLGDPIPSAGTGDASAVPAQNGQVHSDELDPRSNEAFEGALMGILAVAGVGFQLRRKCALLQRGWQRIAPTTASSSVAVSRLGDTTDSLAASTNLVSAAAPDAVSSAKFSTVSRRSRTA